MADPTPSRNFQYAGESRQHAVAAALDLIAVNLGNPANFPSLEAILEKDLISKLADAIQAAAKVPESNPEGLG